MVRDGTFSAGRTHTQKLTATNPTNCQFIFRLDRQRKKHLHIGVTPTRGAETPAYNP
jgi:hypothetical protein